MKTKRWFVGAVLVVALFAGMGLAFAQDAGVKPLDGTLWRCVTNLGEPAEIWQFAAGGKLNYLKTKENMVHLEHAWRQEGAQVTAEMNGGYAVYKGEFNGPSRIKGTAGNVTGKKWTFELTRLTKPAEIKRYERIFKQVKKNGYYTE